MTTQMLKVDYDKLKEKFESHTNLKDISIKNYIIQLRKFRDINISIIDNVKNLRSQYSPCLYKNMVVALLAYLKMNYVNNKSLIIQYKNYLDDLNEQYNSKRKDREKTQRESKNWATLKELHSVIVMIRKQLRKFRILKSPIKTSLTTFERKLLQQYLICCLYLYNPPRRLEYASVKIINFKDYDKTDTNFNYLVIKNTSNKFFVFNKHKTDRKYNNQIIKVNKKLNDALNFFLSYHKNRTHLILGLKGGVITQNTFSKNVSEIFKTYLGKNIGSTTLRKIYISEKIGNMVDTEIDLKRKDIANKMAHTIITQDSYIRK